MKILIIIILIFSISYLAGDWLKNRDTSDGHINNYISKCDLLNTRCKFEYSGHKYSLYFEGVPSPLNMFTVKLIAEHPQPKYVEIQFYMDDMDMGFNHHVLKFDGSTWQAKAILPVCSLGNSDWVMVLEVGHMNLTQRIEFRFNSGKIKTTK